MGRSKKVTRPDQPEPRRLSNFHRSSPTKLNTPIQKNTTRADLLAFCERVQKLDLEEVFGKDLLLEHTPEMTTPTTAQQYISNVEICYFDLLNLCGE